MTGLNPTAISNTLQGDFNSGRGQFGRTYNQDVAVAGGALWTVFPSRPNRYLINGGVADQTFTLPLIGTGSTNAQPGHNLWIKNIGTTNSLIIQNSTAAAVITLPPAGSVNLVATDSPVVNTWLRFADSTSGTDTLQTAYNNSITAADDPQIVITSAPVSIGNAVGNAANDLLKVTNNADTNDFLRVHGVSATTCSVAVGPQVSNSVAGSVVLSDGNQALTTTVTDQSVSAFNNGDLVIGGVDDTNTPVARNMPGVSATAPNELTRQYKISTTGVVATTFDILTGAALSANRSLSLDISILGVTSTAGDTAVGDSVSLKVFANASKKLAAAAFVVTSPISTQTGTLSFATALPDLSFTTTNAVIQGSLSLGSATTDVVQWIITVKTNDFMV